MLRSGTRVRFAQSEIDAARAIGIDLSGVTAEEDFSKAVVALIEVLREERPELLEKIAFALSVATGNRLPARLVAVPDHLDA